MRDGETGAQGRPMTAVKNEKLLGFSVIERMRHVAAQILAGPGGAKPFAFDAQEGDFVERINHAQTRVEFQAVDNAHRIAQPDVFRAQVAMSVDDMPRPHPFGQEPGPLGQKPALDSVDVLHAAGGKPEARIAQNAAIEREAAPQFPDMRLRRDEGGTGPPIKLHEHRGQPIELPALQPALLDRAVEHLRFIQAIHHDQPIDDLATAADRQFVTRGTRQRNNAAVNVGRQPPIETELGAAGGFTPR